MSATSEANSLESFFAIGIQSAKGTAATTLYKTIATVSNLSPLLELRDNRVEHPAATTAWLRAAPRTVTGYLAGARATFALRPKFIVPVLQALGYAVDTTNNTTYYAHVLTQGTNAAHKWATCAWSVADTDGAFVTRGVDMRCTSLSMEIGTEEILCTAEFRGLTVQPMTGSPTYVAEQTDEIVPWLGTRTTMTAGVSGSEYTVVERIRGITAAWTNVLREDDKAVFEASRTALPRESIDLSIAVNEMNVSDDVYEALSYGSTGGTTVTTTPIIGDIDIKFVSADNISGAAVPYMVQIDTPSVQWEWDGGVEASGSDLITVSATAYAIANVEVPSTITVHNNVASY